MGRQAKIKQGIIERRKKQNPVISGTKEKKNTFIINDLSNDEKAVFINLLQHQPSLADDVDFIKLIADPGFLEILMCAPKKDDINLFREWFSFVREIFLLDKNIGQKINNFAHRNDTRSDIIQVMIISPLKFKAIECCKFLDNISKSDFAHEVVLDLKNVIKNRNMIFPTIVLVADSFYNIKGFCLGLRKD